MVPILIEQTKYFWKSLLTLILLVILFFYTVTLFQRKKGSKILKLYDINIISSVFTSSFHFHFHSLKQATEAHTQLGSIEVLGFVGSSERKSRVRAFYLPQSLQDTLGDQL